jgi:hypothetical protein
MNAIYILEKAKGDICQAIDWYFDNGCVDPFADRLHTVSYRNFTCSF